MNTCAIRSASLKKIEVSWFAPLCDEDFEFLGQKDAALQSSWAHTSQILLNADRQGFNNILCPSSFVVGQDTWTFASAIAPLTQQISLLTAIRCGEVYPPMLARAIANLDGILQGRLTINIISSPMPGENADSSTRYRRSREIIEILKQFWERDEVDFKGEFYSFRLPSLPAKPFQRGGPLLYFGGYSPDALELCAQHCDVYLMWPETEERLAEIMRDVSARAARYGRTIDFGLRIHTIVRETEREAIEYSKRLVSRLDDEVGKEIRNRALDAQSLGVARQAQMRDESDNDGFIEAHLWTGIGRARSGCGGALVGSAEQILQKIARYREMGIRAFIFSGYPHLQEGEHFARLVLPHLATTKLAFEQGRISASTPHSPSSRGERL